MSFQVRVPISQLQWSNGTMALSFPFVSREAIPDHDPTEIIRAGQYKSALARPHTGLHWCVPTYGI